MKDLIILEEIKAAEVFTDNGVKNVLERICETARSIVCDVDTAKGRKDIASLANKIARSKTYLDGLGKDLVSDLKKQAKVTDDHRKHIRDTLDELKAEVRKPLTDLEEAQKKQDEARASNIEYMRGKGAAALEGWMTLPIEGEPDSLHAILKLISDIDCGDNAEKWWGEYLTQAQEAKTKALADINNAIKLREKYDAEQAELEKLRKEREERERKDHEDNIRQEAEAKAKRESEERERKAIADKEAAERREKEAKDNAEKQAEAAAQRERDRIDQERRDYELEQKRREADIEHRREINKKAVIDLMATTGLNLENAQAVIGAIAKGEVSYVSINY